MILSSFFKTKNTDPEVKPKAILDSTTVDIFSNNRITQEILRQARTSFNLAFGLTAASAIISFVGTLLLFSGNVSAATVTTAGGATSGTISALWLKFAKDANDRLDKAARILENESLQSSGTENNPSSRGRH